MHFSPVWENDLQLPDIYYRKPPERAKINQSNAQKVRQACIVFGNILYIKFVSFAKVYEHIPPHKVDFIWQHAVEHNLREWMSSKPEVVNSVERFAGVMMMMMREFSVFMTSDAGCRLCHRVESERSF